jgi:hypothetical protein
MWASDERSKMIAGAISAIPYLAIAWAYSRYVANDNRFFWKALGVLFAVRAIYALIEMLGASLAYRLYGRRKMIDRTLQVLRANTFPKNRAMAHDDFDNYIYRIKDNDEYSPALRSLARDIEVAMSMIEGQGAVTGMRLRSAQNAALDIYAPRVKECFKSESERRRALGYNS